jgi:hypothetical protein
MKSLTIVFIWVSLLFFSFLNNEVRACPYKDALSFFQMMKGEVPDSNSLRGHRHLKQDNEHLDSFSNDDYPVDDNHVETISLFNNMVKVPLRRTRKPTKRPSRAPSAAPTRKPTINPTISATTSAAFQPYCTKTSGAAAVPTKAAICTAYKSILADFASILPTDAAQRSNLFGQSLRLAFHDAGMNISLALFLLHIYFIISNLIYFLHPFSGEIDISEDDSMGPDGCISNVGDNAGLIEDTSLVQTVLEPIWQKHCDVMSRADFWALFAKLVVQEADPTGSMDIDYQYGRVDSATCSTGAGRLPNAQLGQSMLQQVFVTQMGLTLDDAGRFTAAAPT